MIQILRASRRIAAPAFALFALAGCSSLSGMLGADKNPPDEFRIVSRAPLSVPPDYGLTAPQPGAPRPQETDIRQVARQIVVDRDGGPVREEQNPRLAGRDAGEAAFLKLAGAADSDPNIRATVNRESAVLAEAGTSFVDDLMFWRSPSQPGVLVDPDAEARRLRENAALGRSPTTGETPTIRRRGDSLKEGIFSGIF
ncbi:MAG: DUF3035 domain-containing protein [Alphaproteobacteria bacterium]